MPEFCLTLLGPAHIEEKLLDVLLLAPGAPIFTSAPVAAHGIAHEHLDQSEQVLGRARAVQVQALVTADQKDALLADLRRQFAGTGLRFWSTPLAEAGEAA